MYVNNMPPDGNAAAEVGAEVRSPGRPRDPVRRAAILDATRALLLEGGYAAVTIRAVALRAGVSRSTVYQWWGDRSRLVEEALFIDFGQHALPDAGDFAGGLAQLVGELVASLTRPEMVCGLPALHADLVAQRHAGQPAGVRYWEPVLARWRAVFARARERGELSSSVDADAALRLSLGGIFFMADAAVPGRTAPSKRALTRYLLNVLLHGVCGDDT